MRLWNGMLGESGHIADHILGHDKTSYFHPHVLFPAPHQSGKKEVAVLRNSKLGVSVTHKTR
jgi:hypothetical protein